MHSDVSKRRSSIALIVVASDLRRYSCPSPTCFISSLPCSTRLQWGYHP